MAVQARQLANANAYVLASIGVTILFLLVLGAASLIYALGALDIPPGRPTLYKRLLIEDGPVEWVTAISLVAAAVFAIIAAFKLPETLRWARPFLFLFSIFSLLMSLEEISWGQRVFGIESTEFFLEHSSQEEINAHNVVQKYLERKQFPIRKTREIAAVVLFVYGVILPILNCFGPFASMFRRLRLIIPPPALILGFFAGALLAWFDEPTGREEEIAEFLFGLCLALLVPLWLLQQRYVLVSESPGLARAVPI